MAITLYRLFLIPYTLVLLYLMLIGVGRTPMDHHVVRFTPIISTFSFVEHNLTWNNWPNIFRNIFGNIFLFLPYGFLGWLHPKLLHYKTLIFTFLSTVIIVETIQYFSRLGVFDIDDLILNCSGVSLGFLLKNFIGNQVKRQT